ncbi:glycosyltransferase [Filimonas lacunae]|nr:glycosyltransferase [Filimonas lacunae]
MVVHDTMRCVLGPDGLFDPSGSNADKLAYLTHRASGVISISHTTCKDLADLTGLSETDITTIHTGNLLNTELETSNNLSLPSQYLLFVGDRTGRKNFKLFISAITDILQAQLELHVVCTGPCNKWEYDMLCKLQVADKVQFIEANDQVLVSLYKNAKALIYPSIYEGYGLPVLEAMSLGCPVITSRLSSIPEVGKDAVIYIDPYQKISIATAVNQVLHAEKSWLSDLTDKAMQIAMQQTPQKMASLFKTAFETVVQNSYKKSKA